MKNTTANLLNDLNSQLQFIRLETEDAIKAAELSLKVLLSVIDKLKRFTIKYKFKNEAEEIYFFKYQKPLFISKLIYHNRVLNIETKKPYGGEKVTRKYLNNELDKLKRFFDNNLEFYKYHRTNSTYLDHKYFIRGKHDIKLSLDTFYFEADHRFCTSHDYKVAKIIAHDLVQVYLEDEIANLDRKELKAHSKTEVLPKPTIFWTGSKVALIELIYALHADGSLNNGKIELNAIADFFEKSFGIELGQFHRSFLELRERKTGRTKYIDTLKEKLIKRMDDADDLL
ncbi:tetracycline regulation of excision, RteC [Terrimonas sp.]|uniref:RteC domain-containing protein n=1 Tax=Terrimonas sp. TaxID=1914338 RepID=UPI000D51B786|nr:RteC domain-containing protein [Terrimonas sp.]PVD53602.1 tetracycline regulation of excision, RteC [Terrimonas sp.]